MRTKFFTLLFLSLLSGSLFAQTTVTIQQVQNVTSGNLGSCIDSSSYNGDTVIVHGVVVMNGSVGGNPNAQVASGQNTWIQVGNGDFSGLDVYGQSADAFDITTLVAGDSIRVTGVIGEYNGETEIVPIAIQVLGSSTVSTPPVVNVGDLNNNLRENQLPTGEKYEGMYVELQNLTISQVYNFSGGTRYSFDAQDASGNTINISDRFASQRTANGFVPWNVGDQITSIKGIIAHSANGCTGSGGRGYEINPFKASDIVFGVASPSIANITRNHITPTSSQTTTISATITDDGTISSATLHYAVGEGTATYTTVAMTNTTGNTYTADIPAQVDGAFVKFYISATDNDALTTNIPNVPNSTDPKWFIVRDNGTQIYDVQYVPNTFNADASGYKDLTVTVTGVVTASTNDLGYVHIQQENQLGWSGLFCTGNTLLGNLNLGDKVTVTGTVEENFGMTILGNISNLSTSGTGTISALPTDPDIFSTYDKNTNEMYESVLVKLHNGSNKLYVVDDNADDPSNFAEYRVGKDTLDPNTGCRVLVGRQNSSAFSSLNVSFVNDSMWASTDGIMNENPAIVKAGGSGATHMDSLIGIIYYSYSNMKLLPRTNNDFYNINLTVGLNDLIENKAFSVYPNPSKDNLFIELNGEVEGSDYSVAIYDINGKQVASQKLNTFAKNTIDVSALNSGMYFSVISGKNVKYVQRNKLMIVK